jgi:DNA invertase Pin-like site-specific DNA recombinase
MQTDPELTRLHRRAKTLTRRIERTVYRKEELAAMRAEVWEQLLALGCSKHEVARGAGVHVRQVGRALERYGSNGE